MKFSLEIRLQKPNPRTIKVLTVLDVLSMQYRDLEFIGIKSKSTRVSFFKKQTNLQLFFVACYPKVTFYIIYLTETKTFD